MRIRNSAWMGVAALLASVAGHAADSTNGWEADVGAGVTHTDNLERTATDPESDNLATGTAKLLVLEQTRSLFADVDALGTWRDLPSDATGERFMPNVNAFALWTISPEVFAWNFSDNLGTISNNANGGLDDANQRRVNVYNTGPDLRLGNGINALTVQARYGAVNYSGDKFYDNERLSAAAGFEHQTDGGAVTSLTAERSRTRERQTKDINTIDSAMLGYTNTGARGTVDAKVGFSRLSRDPGIYSQSPADSANGFSGDVRLERTLTPNTSLSVDVVRRYGDSADVFERQQSLEPDTNVVGNVLATNNPIQETSEDVGYGWIGRRSSATLSVSHYEQQQALALVPTDPAVNVDRKGTAAQLDVGFSFTPRLSLDGSAARLNWTDETNDDAHSTAATLALGWQVTNAVDVTLSAQRYTQDSTQAVYTENRYYAGITVRLTRNKLDSTRRPGLDTAARRRVQQER